jgi:mono/diheme cytochrome c family protein
MIRPVFRPLAGIVSISLACASGAPAAEAAKVDFAKSILPILEKSCFECHGPEKQKGKLRLDSKEAALKGGDTGPALMAGEPDKSELYRRIILPKDHDDIMPNKGEPLTKAQTDLIRDWIQQGAVWPEGLVVKAAPAAESKEEATGPKPTPAELKAVTELARLGIDARPIAAGINWRYANLRVAGPDINPKAFALLNDVQNLSELNLATVKLKDADLAHLAGLKNLRKLHLEHTAVTDAGLAHLKGLAGLEYLNLFNTAVTDKGLIHLQGLKKLKSLYLFETRVTDAGVAALQKALPQTRIDRGWDLAELAKIAPPEEKKKDDAKAAEKPEDKKAEKKAEPQKKKAAKKKKAENN